MYRIEDYRGSDRAGKIIDPDGEIHLRRIRLERELQTQQANQFPSGVEWPNNCWTLSLHNMPPSQHFYLLAHLGSDAEKNPKEMHRGAYKISDKVMR